MDSRCEPEKVTRILHRSIRHGEVFIELPERYDDRIRINYFGDKEFLIIIHPDHPTRIFEFDTEILHTLQ